MARKIIQVSTVPLYEGASTLVAVSDDGIAFEYSPNKDGSWLAFPPLPQGPSDDLKMVRAPLLETEGDEDAF